MALLSVGSHLSNPAAFLQGLAQPAGAGVGFLQQMLAPSVAANVPAVPAKSGAKSTASPLDKFKDLVRQVLDKAGVTSNTSVVLKDDGLGGLQVDEPADQRLQIERILTADPAVMTGFQSLVSQNNAFTQNNGSPLRILVNGSASNSQFNATA